jgi:predicted GNAT family acetyltransferase
MRADLAEMQTLSVDELLAIAQTQTNAIQYENHVQLLEKNQTESLSTENRKELTNLRQTADRLTLRKAYVWESYAGKGIESPRLRN